MCIESVLWFEQRTDRWPRYHQFGLALRSTEMNCLLLIASHWICECDSEFRWTQNRNINRNKQQSTGTNLSERSPLFSGSWCPTERFHNKEALWHRWHRSKAHAYYIQKGTINMAQMKMLCIFAIPHSLCMYIQYALAALVNFGARHKVDSLDRTEWGWWCLWFNEFIVSYLNCWI